MITTPEEYEFVDFAGGDLPTDNINGGIMPLVNAPYKLKAEDIAFLTECVCDKMGAFRHSKISTSWLDELSAFAPPTDKQVLSKKISSAQISAIRNRIGTCLTRGISDYGWGLLGSDFEEHFFETDCPAADYNAHRAAHLETIYSTYGGNWPASTTAAQFAVGAKVESDPILSLYADARNFVRPAFQWYISPRSQFVQESGSGSGPSSTVATNSLGYVMNNMNSNAYAGHWVWFPDSNNATLFEVPTDIVIEPHLWLFYAAYNRHYLTATSTSARFGFGFVDLNRYGTLVRSGDTNKLLMTSGQSLAMYNDMLANLGWTEHPIGTPDVFAQTINIMYSHAAFLTATPNGRTKWWS